MRTLNDELRLAVEGRGGLVEQDDWGVLQERSRERNALARPARDLDPKLAHLRVVAVWQGADELVGMGRARGYRYRLIRGVLPPNLDVVTDSSNRNTSWLTRAI